MFVCGEHMADDILKIVLPRNIKNKKLSKDDIRKICYIIINKMKYDKMVRRIIFEKNNDNINDFASFDGEDLVFHLLNGCNYAYDNYQKLKKDNIYLNGGAISYINFEILNTIFHEFAHIRQDYLVCRRINNKEAEIYRICFQILDNIKGFYKDHYGIILTEVNAFNEGILKSFNIYKNAPSDIISKNDKEIYARLAFNELLSKYFKEDDKIISSSDSLIDVLNYYHYNYSNLEINRLKELIYQNNYSLYERLKMGFPISMKEYKYLNILYDNISVNYNFVKKIKK